MKKTTSIIMKKLFLIFSGAIFLLSIWNFSYLSLGLIFAGIILLSLFAVRCPQNLFKEFDLLSFVVALPVTAFSGQIFYRNWLNNGILWKTAYSLNISEKTLVLFVTAVVCIIILCFSANVFSLLRNSMESGNFKRIYGEQNQTKIGLDYIDIVAGLIIALYISMRFYTAPLSENSPSVDSSVFLYIGKQMHNGYIPYKDLFDHKGLLLYFYQYLGWGISSKPYTGIWIIELVNMFAAVMLCILTVKLFTNKRLIAYISVILVFAAVGAKTCYGGNFTEEYALPWLLLSLYIFLKYFKSGKFKVWEIGLLGVSFVAVLMLRVNMISTFIAFMPIIFIKMLVKKEWKDLGRAVLGFVVGTVITLIPFGIYLVLNGNIKEMIDYYIKFNMFYTNTVHLFERVSTVSYFIYILGLVSGFSVLFSIYVFKGKKLTMLNLWYFLVSFVLVNLSGYSYQHYAMIMIPALIVPVSLFLSCVYSAVMPIKPEGKQTVKSNTVKQLSSVVICGLFMLVMMISYSVNVPNIKSCPELVSYLKTNTKKEDDVLIVGTECIYYLEADRTTKNKFFFQYPTLNYNDDLYDEFLISSDKNKSDYIIMSKYSAMCNDKSTNIYDFISRISNMKNGNKKMYSMKEYENFFAFKKQE